MRNLIKKLIYNFIKFLVVIYKKLLSPLLGESCRFYPPCSNYYLDSIENNGIFKGHILFLSRIIRCNSLYKGGIDYPRKNVSLKKCFSLIFKYELNS